MAEQVTILINDPGTNNVYSVVLNEASRTQVTALVRAKEIIFAEILGFYPDVNLHNSMSPADVTTIAQAAAQDMQTAGYIP